MAKSCIQYEGKGSQKKVEKSEKEYMRKEFIHRKIEMEVLEEIFRKLFQFPAILQKGKKKKKRDRKSLNCLK